MKYMTQAGNNFEEGNALNIKTENGKYNTREQIKQVRILAEYCIDALQPTQRYKMMNS